MTGSRVIGHLRARSLVIVTRFDQNWFMHFGTTLDYVVDRKNLRETEHRRSRLCKETGQKKDPAAASGRVRRNVKIPVS